MANNKLPEVWLRGPLSDIPALLQPVAYALLQAREELNVLMITFPDELLWNKVAGMASPGFHLQHLTGVLDRLFTYARAEALNEEQVSYLSTEGKPTTKIYNAIELVEAFNKQVDEALTQLSNVDETTLTDFRGVGRAQLPSTIMGLYTHSAEHTMRHLGQLIVTVAVLKSP
ncbi:MULTISPECIES: DinB family protein [unclassified Mucilaginibacter]|uniref:DinB family protein n=1 Tax=unclassified Mucilaginibacter TaxID=2617802 RepID=UPI002AC8F84F|nr:MULTISPECIES: DinB family protein [unclassified Mucilaginibacter]MEB0264113.1 DinB family protein [Mucilaginibacter sp. 10I4]MEB0277224.1 DinB family protein [Mucilaginibacter sp. 10B2]MEB0300844.1 DinB family protein [Mucilaginibacter sp. 5C4]WPX25292.1 DinB family protein [Mucilaginibacter sp. 5C4]